MDHDTSIVHTPSHGMPAQLIIEQRITPWVNRYHVYGVVHGRKGPLLAFAEQKRLALKERFTFFTDETKRDVAFSFHAERVMDIHGRFFIEDPAGQRLGVFKKEFQQSLIRSTWSVLDNHDQPRLTFVEGNLALAITRRTIGFVAGFIPFVGILVDIVVDLLFAFLRYHFVIHDGPANGPVIGDHRKTALIRDHYVLSMADEQYAQQDWRVIASVAVALDALQGR